MHPSLPAFWDGGRAGAGVRVHRVGHPSGYTEIAYRPGDVLLFGPEPDGLPASVLADAHVTEQVRIPMLPGRRSLNLANAASIAVYEAWRQHGFAAPD